ncbi:hypothetical protein LTR64_008213 [Lithohypha guttulata]|uniref:uncharacterized protein n=1 Tax=Lithohypha guttulata TaxID=1690604 RepID=UPI002DE197EE|nr:hypothetical protein LTR51_008365 [Lithohypha guttulata]
MAPTPMVNGRTDKSSKKQSKIVVLAVPPSILKRFVPKKQSPPTPSPPPAPMVAEVPHLEPMASQENNSESNSTPAPAHDMLTLNGTTKQKGSATNGVKRSTPMPDSMQKPRGKPGPKKKPRLEDGTIDHSVKPAATTTANHKLGPKANTGFINANLRALDRSGTPCRRWEKKGFTLKSFTGHAWELPSWKGSDKSAFADRASDSSTKDISMSSDQKHSESDTAAGSNAGDRTEKMDITTPTPSSPPTMLPRTAHEPILTRT